MLNITTIKQSAGVKLRRKAKKDLRSTRPTKTPESELTTEQPSTKKIWTYKKDVLPPKDKEEATTRREEGHFHHNNQILYPLSGWPQTGKSFHCNWVRVLTPAPHQTPQPGGLTSRGIAPRAPGFEGQQGLRAEATQDCWRAQNDVMRALELRTRQQLLGAWARPTCASRRVPRGGGGQRWLTIGARTVAVDTPGNTCWCDLSWSVALWHWAWHHPTGCRPQCLDPSTTAGWKHSPAHQKTGCQKTSWPHGCLKHSSWHGPAVRGTGPSCAHRRAGTSPSLQETCPRLWTNLTCQGTDTRGKESWSPAAWATETGNTES